ncbi:MAG TPA: PrsW family glutamic-type intramembrane protease [Vicinamibacteria bacterium]|nr:PrsW family glutamic-type intramembrane protease [Vicinamibacteria bacterium]
MLHAALSLLPVLVFLALLVLLDSFKLVALRAVLRSIAVGALAALAAAALHLTLLEATGADPRWWSRWIAPVTEELLKAAYVAWLVRRERVGFLVDAGLHGFAVGAGFALVENVEYLRTLGERGVWLWVARGFGTAILHGSATTMFAIVSRALADRAPGRPWRVYLPGLAAAVLLHAAFNRFADSLATTVVLLVALPLLLIGVFERSERATREWLGTGFDTDAELLRSIVSGEISRTPAGRYLRSLQSRFDGMVVADMVCLLRIRAELSMRVKGMLLAREVGLEVPPGAGVEEMLAEMRYLEGAIGPTGRLALKPIQTRSGRELWQLHVLEQAGRVAAGLPSGTKG